jgi:hypothetical protein
MNLLLLNRNPLSDHECFLKYWISRSCFWAAERDLNVPKFLLFPVLGFFFREYSRYPPAASLRIIFFLRLFLKKGTKSVPQGVDWIPLST